ncbi:hypothetical protein, partial [Comamonas sp.]|uniref:hypothetical protein n=1 Tax=Comamonas sp. TaxID=34028 RepID=UPI0025857E8B
QTTKHWYQTPDRFLEHLAPEIQQDMGRYRSVRVQTWQLVHFSYIFRPLHALPLFLEQENGCTSRRPQHLSAMRLKVAPLAASAFLTHAPVKPSLHLFFDIATLNFPNHLGEAHDESC